MSPTDLTPLADLDGEDGAGPLDRVLGRGLPPFAWDPSRPAPVSTLDLEDEPIVRVRLEVGDGEGLGRDTTTIPLSCLADADEFDREHPGLKPVFGRARA